MRGATPRRRVLDRFVDVEELPGAQRYRVGAGDKRAGQGGIAIAVIRLRHCPAYEVVLQLDSGKLDSFNPMQLFPEKEESHALQGG